jgi:uncharacterized protein YydD (DUF2326 family)
MSSTDEQHTHESSDRGDGSGVAAQSQNPGVGQLDRTPGNVDKIREILFGTNMREYDARFARLEATVLKEAGDLRESTRRRFEALENHLKTEIESLHARLRAEREERAEGLGQRSRDLKDTEDALNRKIRELEDRAAAAESALRQDILHHSHILTEDIRAMQAEITSLVEKRFQELSRGKTDRAMLGTLLTEIAMRLNDQFHVPVSE